MITDHLELVASEMSSIWRGVLETLAPLGSGYAQAMGDRDGLGFFKTGLLLGRHGYV